MARSRTSIYSTLRIGNKRIVWSYAGKVVFAGMVMRAVLFPYKLLWAIRLQLIMPYVVSMAGTWVEM